MAFLKILLASISSIFSFCKLTLFLKLKSISSSSKIRSLSVFHNSFLQQFTLFSKNLAYAFCFVLFCFVLFCFVLFCFVLFCFVVISLYSVLNCVLFFYAKIGRWGHL